MHNSLLTIQNIADGASLNETHASTKSHIFSLQLALQLKEEKYLLQEKYYICLTIN